MGLGRAAPASRTSWPPRRDRIRPGRRLAEAVALLDETDVVDGAGRLPGLAAGAARRGDRAGSTACTSTSPRRCARSTSRWRSGRSSGAAVLHAAERGPSRPGPHLVAAGRPGPVRGVGGADHRLPRGRARPPPAARPGPGARRPAVPAPAGRRGARARRGLGAVRGAAGRRARLVRRPRAPGSACSRRPALRAARVVIDIGLHLDLPLPAAEAAGTVERGPSTVATEVLRERGRLAAHRLHPRGGPLLRLAGPGDRVQAGRAGLAGRPGRGPGPAGAGFDLKRWHTARAGARPGRAGLPPRRPAHRRLTSPFQLDGLTPTSRLAGQKSRVDGSSTPRSAS